jgi:hypothetical protein
MLITLTAALLITVAQAFDQVQVPVRLMFPEQTTGG